MKTLLAALMLAVTLGGAMAATLDTPTTAAAVPVDAQHDHGDMSAKLDAIMAKLTTMSAQLTAIQGEHSQIKAQIMSHDLAH